MRALIRCAILLGLLCAFSVGIAGATPFGQVTEFTDPGSNNAQIQAGIDGNLWFTDRSGAIGRITTAGVITKFALPGGMPFSIISGPDGKLWFADSGTTSAIGTIDPATGSITEFTAGLNAGAKPMGIAVGPDGNLWFTDASTTHPAIGMIDRVTHAITEFSLSAGSVPQQGIVAGPDGNIWFGDRGPTPALGRFDLATHTVTEFSNGLPTGNGPGASIAVGPDGNLWFVVGATHPGIGRATTTGAITVFSAGLNATVSLGRLAVGPDGNVWFADRGTIPAIGRITPDGVITEFTSTAFNAGAQPSGMAVGSDGNIWFNDQGVIRGVGRFGTDAPAASVTAPSVVGSDGVGVPQTCGGDTWSTWAGQQPSHNAFGFDGYRWLLDGSAIAGATGTSYTPRAADAGHQLACAVTVTYTLTRVTVSAMSTAVHVKGAAEQLSELASVVSGVGPGKSLAAKVAAIASGDDSCDMLGDFRSEVSAQTGKKLSDAQAADLLVRAQQIGAALGC